MHCINSTQQTHPLHPYTTGILEQNRPFARTNLARSATQLIAFAALSFATVAVISGCKSRPVATQAPAPAPVATAPAATPRLPAAANWADYRRRAAQMIIASNPGASFSGPQPDQWQGIATVTVFLNADGSVKSLDLMRGSRVAPQVNDMALQAARRAANYGPVSNLPQPWQFNETFLYNDDNKFQLITIVEGR